MSTTTRKLRPCDTCDRDHHDVVSMGRDSNGDPEAPDMCFICRKESERGRSWCPECKRYEHTTCLDRRIDEEG